MVLTSLYLKNFRGHRDSKIRVGDSLTVIVGRNDVGKSSILDALEIFFNNDLVKIERDDLSIRSEAQHITVGATFAVDPKEPILIESDVQTDLGEEFLLNADGLLEIQKTWDCSGSTITAKSLTTRIIAHYPSKLSEAPPVTAKIQDLRRTVEELGAQDLVSDNRVASALRRAIYATIETSDRELIAIETDREDAKRIYTSLSANLPLYALFQSDRQNKDTDRDFQDPLKVITKQAIADFEDELARIVTEIETRATRKGHQTLAKLAEMSPEIAQTLSPEVKHKNWESLFSFSFTGDEGIPLNKRGSGVRRLILLNYFRSEAEQNTKSQHGTIFAIEEPETSQHPDFQRMLIDSLLELSETEGRQVIVTTHSPEIARMSGVDSAILVRRDDRGNTVVDEPGETSVSAIVTSLGLMPYVGRLVVCVEGESDVDFLRAMGEIPELKSIFDLADADVPVIPMTGDNLKHWINRNYLSGTNVVEFHIYDGDVAEYSRLVEEMNKEGGNRSGAVTNSREMENYLHWALLEDLYRDHGLAFSDSEKTEWSQIDVPRTIAERTPFKESTVKRHLAKKVAPSMTTELLVSIGVYAEVESWFQTLRRLWLTS